MNQKKLPKYDKKERSEGLRLKKRAQLNSDLKKVPEWLIIAIGALALIIIPKRRF